MSGRVFEALLGTAWAMEEDTLELMVRAIRRETDPQVIARELGQPLQNTRSVFVRDRVAVVPVTGPLFRRANLFTELSGATSLEILATEIGEALRNPEVDALILDVDSPGGQVNGTAELAELVFQARQEKRVTAFISGTGASGAYWLASAADEVVVDATALVGSVGAILRLGRSDDEGDVVVVSSQSPRKAMDLDDEDHRAHLQGVVDELANVFVDTVARNRGVSREVVLSDFGRGGVLVGQQAVDARMADRVSTLEALIRELRENHNHGRASFGVATDQGEDMDINTVQDLREVHPELVKEIETSVASEARATVAEERTEAAEKERERIFGILALPATGQEQLRSELAKDPSVSVDAAAHRILTARKGAEASYLEAREKHEKETDHPSPDAATGGDDPDAKVAAFILNAGRGTQAPVEVS